MQIPLRPGIRPSRELPASAGIRPDDAPTAAARDGSITPDKPFRHRTLKERAADFGGNLRLSEEIPPGAPLGNELWWYHPPQPRPSPPPGLPSANQGGCPNGQPPNCVPIPSHESSGIRRNHSPAPPPVASPQS